MSQASDQYKALKREEREHRKLANREEYAAKKAERARQIQVRGGMRSLGRFVEAQAKKVPEPVMEIPDPRLMSDEVLVAALKAAQEANRYDWRGFRARPAQIQPDSYSTFAFIGGRGTGKTELGSQAVREWCSEPNQRIAIMAATHQALREVNLDGPSGLRAIFPDSEIKSIKTGLGDVGVDLMNGSRVSFFTAEAPDAVRGRAFDAVLVDEYASFKRDKAKDAVEQLWYCMRDSANPRMIITSTPKRVPHIVDLINRAEKGESGLVLRRGKTRDNIHLSEVALRELERMFAGTRMGRQEMDGELVMDLDNALWDTEMIEYSHWDIRDDDGYPAPLPRMVGVVVGLDPSGSKDGDATGIVAVGWDKSNCLYVLGNATTKGTPAERYEACALLAYEHGASHVWYETAYGGDQSAYAVQQAWKNLVERGEIPADVRPPDMMPSRIKGDKAERAGSVVNLYEQQISLPERRRIYHAVATEENKMIVLEDELLSWETHSKKSPNCMDALVHAARAVMRLTGQEPMQISVPKKNAPGGFSTVRRIGGGYQPFGN